MREPGYVQVAGEGGSRGRSGRLAGAALVGGLCLAAGVAFAGGVGDGSPARGGIGSVQTLALAAPVEDVVITEARAPGRPLVIIDPGHGGADPGAKGVSGNVRESDITLQLARELRQALAERGRVRVGLTRDGDLTLTLDDRSGIARRLGADLFLSIHADSAANPLARGATVYSLSDVASDPDAARFAAALNGAEGIGTGAGGSAQALLADLAVRDQMDASADFAVRVLNKAAGRVALRPEPHRFAAFRVLRCAEAPAVLFEAGYLSNVEDEAMLLSKEARARIVGALAQAIEVELASRAAARSR
ncbi:N-acetylmuramoyl-L-alanine amidase [Sphingomonas sp. GCM10030256]|uniref:N-acetylmuramoyl-L-alanine amidase family protein n=1 Tax=Sphingomonas sp. GCM10030256 TaxID=3273427 RepID=UPI0036067925